MCVTNLTIDKLMHFTANMVQGSKNFIVLNEVDSTNNYANHMIGAGNAENGTVVLSRYQLQGRGQAGNHWESSRGLNMLISLVLFPGFLPPENQFFISMIASNAIVSWLQEYIKNVKVKWPNDIYVENRKIAGMLIETSVQGNDIHSSIIGIGLNLNQVTFSPGIPNPVSLKMLTGIDYDVEDVALNVRKHILKWYEILEKGDVSLIDGFYVNHLYRNNEWAGYIYDGQRIEARITGIDDYGRLILETRQGDSIICSFKEIVFEI